MTTVPEVRFDASSATRVFPRPEVKNAVLVKIPRTEDGSEIPTFIKPEWGGVQVFYGDYYGVISEGTLAYGSAKEQWEAMHVSLGPGYWVKTAVPTAYKATEPCRIVTLIPNDDGSIREANYTLQTGDWILRQPGGEVQHVRAAKYEKIYLTENEVAINGLQEMTDAEFGEWALSQAWELMPA